MPKVCCDCPTSAKRKKPPQNPRFETMMLFVLFLVPFVQGQNQPLLQNQYDALRAVYADAKCNASFGTESRCPNFNATALCPNTPYLECDGGYVTRIDTTDACADGGRLSTMIGVLTRLTFFAVTNCALTGTLPTEVGQLTALQSIFTTGNRFVSTIPTQIGRMSALEWLSIERSGFFGTGTVVTSFPSSSFRS
jgi:hypothetical protein